MNNSNSEPTVIMGLGAYLRNLNETPCLCDIDDLKQKLDRVNLALCPNRPYLKIDHDHPDTVTITTDTGNKIFVGSVEQATIMIEGVALGFGYAASLVGVATQHKGYGVQDITNAILAGLAGVDLTAWKDDDNE